MATSTTPPPLQGPTAREKKYDRQLRLWAAAGQQALEESHILLLNDGPGVVGIETLKNLVLPGIGNFTIIDERNVEEEDLGVNFFLSEESLGKPRAQETCRFLKELNPAVNGHAIQGAITDLFDSPANVHRNYTLILIVSPTRLASLEKIASLAWKQLVPLFYIHSVGFYSQFSLQLPAQFPIVDTHPDPASTQDLRLLDPWLELAHFTRVKTAGMESLSDHEHGHIPYLLLLLHYLERWKSTHEGRSPEDYKEKTAFRELVRQGIRRDNPEGGEENFDEAVGSVLKSLNPPSISSGLREIFEVDECVEPKSDSSNFWLVAHAIRQFYGVHKTLPLPGALPDMKAQSADYIQLQNIYKTKARKDLAEVTSEVRALEKQLGRHAAVDDKEIEAFCKGAAHVKLVKGRPIRIAIESESMDVAGKVTHPLGKTESGEPMHFGFADRAKYLSREIEDEGSLIPIYISILAYDHFLETKADLPPTNKGDFKPLDLPNNEYTQITESYTFRFLDHIKHSGGDFDIEAATTRLRPIIAELGRANGAELHNISALTGGMVAQEVIKVITKQYIPIDNTCVFDGITSKTAVFKL